MFGHSVIGLKPKKTKKLSYWTLGVNPTLQRELNPGHFSLQECDA